MGGEMNGGGVDEGLLRQLLAPGASALARLARRRHVL